jgi:O-antigen/teichoic acid export membrane protein
LLVHAFPVPPELRQTFVRLLIAQNICLGFFQPFLVFSNVLQAHQRYDRSNLTQILSLCTGLFTLWMGFHIGFGIYSLLLALFFGTSVSAIATIFLCIRLKLLPPSGSWGKVSRPVYGQLFGFGLELFIQNIGGQLLNASQVLVISGFIGFDAAATYVVCTKTFTLAQQLIGRIFDFSASALSEIFARGESARFRKRFTDVLVLTGGSGILAGLTAAACNHSFVSVWTHGKVSWSPLNDWLFGALTVVVSINRTYGGIAWIMKNTRKTRYIYFVEGVAFVALAACLASRFGIPGILLAAIVADCAICGIYGLRITAEALGASPREFIREALQPAARYFLLFTPIALLVWALNLRWKPLPQLCANAVVLAVVGSLLFRLLALSPALRAEIEQMLRRLRRRVAGDPQA